MKKVLKKITALAAALMMVPVMTVSAAPPIDLGSVWDDPLEEISNRFPGLTDNEKGIVYELTYLHTDVGSDEAFVEYLLPDIESVCRNWGRYPDEKIIVVYSVVFAGVSRDLCVSIGADAAELDALIAKLGGNVGTPVASQAASAPVWKQDGNGWWIENPDGSYLMNQWYQSPESGLWYYMGADGYMLTNTTTPDGCMVNADGVWVQ